MNARMARRRRRIRLQKLRKRAQMDGVNARLICDVCQHATYVAIRGRRAVIPGQRVLSRCPRCGRSDHMIAHSGEGVLPPRHPTM